MPKFNPEPPRQQLEWALQAVNEAAAAIQVVKTHVGTALSEWNQSTGGTKPGDDNPNDDGGKNAG